MYKKFDSDLSVLYEKETILDQYNNSNVVSMEVDSYRRPAFAWDSYDTQGSHIILAKKESQDYRVVTTDENYRFSVKEMLNIKIDPYFSSDLLKFSYRTAEDIIEIARFVESPEELDRVICADYLVKHIIPCFVDVKIRYTGNKTLAEEGIRDYINGKTINSISASGIISSLPLSTSARVLMPVHITTRRHNINGTITIKHTESLIEEPRTVRFIANNIQVTS